MSYKITSSSYEDRSNEIQKEVIWINIGIEAKRRVSTVSSVNNRKPGSLYFEKRLYHKSKSSFIKILDVIR